MRALVPVSDDAASLFTALLRQADDCADRGERWPGFDSPRAREEG